MVDTVVLVLVTSVAPQVHPFGAAGNVSTPVPVLLVPTFIVKEIGNVPCVTLAPVPKPEATTGEGARMR